MKNPVSLILRINLVVFFMWYLVPTDLMIQNFLVSSSAVINGRFWTMITSVFSHNMPFHILINMFVLIGFGSVMEDVLGAKRFMIFYLMAGVTGSIGHCLSSTYLLENPDLPALGASGAISGVLVLFSLKFPKELIYIFGIIPMPALMATGLFVGMDLWGLIAQSQGSGIPIGYGAHLGGAITGVIMHFYLKHRKGRPGSRHYPREIFR